MIQLARLHPVPTKGSVGQRVEDIIGKLPEASQGLSLGIKLVIAYHLVIMVIQLRVLIHSTSLIWL
jgi:hypothetical protein